MEEEKKTDVESGADLVEKKKRKKRHEVAYESVKIDTSVDKKKRHEVAYESVKIDTSVDKKKKKKRHEFVNDVVSEHDVESETGALEVKKMKKKKRRIAPVDVQNEITNVTDCIETDSSVKKKTPENIERAGAKKKKKRHEVAYESVKIDTSVDKKKKKKRHEFVNDVVSEHDVESETGALEVKKMKKKKRGIAPVDDCIETDSSVKKKTPENIERAGAKKKKKRHEVAYESVKIDTSVDKKKRHEFVNDVVSEHVESETGALEVKKMKKKKKRGIAHVDDCIETDSSVKKKTPENIERAGAKKKKKKSHEVYKDENIRSDSMDDVRSSNVGTDTKRKKKHRKTKESLTESLAECENNAGKKKKFKGDRLSEEVDRKRTNNKDKLKTAKAVLGSADGVEKVKEKELSKKVKKRKRNADDTESSKKSKSEKKRIRFSDTVEDRNLPEYLKYRKLNSEGAVAHGLRYTLEEDAKIMKAVDDYIVENGLASDGVDNKDLDENWKKARSMVMNCKKHPELMGCWKVISAALPRRTVKSVYERAHLFYDSTAEEHKWTNEEIDKTLSFHEKKGPKWRELGDSLGKSRKHTRDAYRRNKLRDTKKEGAWSQEELQKLFESVNRDICIKSVQEKKVKHGMLRDNIAWGEISESLGTRTSANCCNKWYNQICSSMVVQGKWSDTDDYRLVDALYSQNGCCIEDVDWNNLLEHRSGDLCQKRWAEMSRNLGDYRQKPFLEQLEVLHQRYDQALIEAREIYEKKDPVDV